MAKNVDQQFVRDLAQVLKENDLTEIEVETDDLRIRVAREMHQTVTVGAPMASAPAASTPAPVASAQPAGGEATASADDVSSHPGLVTSPMVGTAYVAPEPGAPAFVKIGSDVKEGQTLLIIEAMKTMNHIPAPHSGKVTRILIQDGQPVEFGEPLLIVE